MSKHSRQPTLFDDPTSSAEDFRAKISPWLESVLVLLELEADSSGSSCGSLKNSLPHGFLSKTSLDCCRRTKDGTWLPSSGRWLSAGMGGPIGCLTLNISDSPSDGSVCSL